MCTSQIFFCIFIRISWSVLTIIRMREVSPTTIIYLITIIFDSNINATSNTQYISAIIKNCIFWIFNFENILIIELNNKGIFVINITLILKLRCKFDLEVSSECSVVFRLYQIKDVLFVINPLLKFNFSKAMLGSP